MLQIWFNSVLNFGDGYNWSDLCALEFWRLENQNRFWGLCLRYHPTCISMWNLYSHVKTAMIFIESSGYLKQSSSFGFLAYLLRCKLYQGYAMHTMHTKKSRMRLVMCVLSTPEAPASNGTPPPRPDPAPQSSYLGSMAPARGWLEGGMREGAQQCKNARTAHLAGSRLRTAPPRHELCWAARRKR